MQRFELSCLLISASVAGLAILLTGGNAIADSKTDNSGCCAVPQSNPEYVALEKEMQEHFRRNLMPNVYLPRSATVKFFLTPEGQIRNAYILNSSGNKNGDLACIDAVYAASPLRKPPITVGPLLPPPGGLFLPPTQFGSHNYTFEFKAPIKVSDDSFQYPVIPLEILYRYPGLFEEKYILSKKNLLDFKKSRIDAEIVEFSRFSWEKFYRDKSEPTREEVLEWAQQIRYFYLHGKPPEKPLEIKLSYVMQIQIIPNQIITQYPKLFSWSEINSRHNFMTVPIRVHFDYYCQDEWQKFCETNSYPTRHRVLAWSRNQRKKIREMIRKGIQPTHPDDN